MELTLEQRKKARMAKDAQELLELARTEGVELTDRQARDYFTKLHPPAGELADDELEAVSGGGCGGVRGGPDNNPYVPDIVQGFIIGRKCLGCDCDCWETGMTTMHGNQTYQCVVCGETCTISSDQKPKSLEYVQIDRNKVHIKSKSERYPFLGSV